MFSSVAKKVFGSKNDRELKRMNKIVKNINNCEEQIRALSDEQLKAKTVEFQERLQKGETLDQLLPEAFSVVREATDRTLGMRHFDVQMIGGIALHEGRIAEMKTGEGKTLMATLPVYLNALTKKGVHLVTVNDYLAERDANWMRPVYEFLGMTVGVILSNQDIQHKKEAYAADITYGTNNEFGFDYLRDNMAFSAEEQLQRGHFFSIVDEVDSILIDEARTPLIISGASEDSSELYKAINVLIPGLERQEENDGQIVKPGHYVLDEKQRQIEFTEDGHQVIESLLVKKGLLDEGDTLYSAKNLNLLHHVTAGLKAHVLFQKDVDYIVQDNEVVLIDEHTGRMMTGRRLSEGLHQAIEAKEGVFIQAESQTLASTTFQNYFRLYEKLSGMTGTADTEAFEFRQIYGLDVVVIPTNRPLARKDLTDLVFMTEAEKFAAVVQDIRKFVDKGVPVLVGTVSIESSEVLANLLTKEKIPHSVLNAKFHEKEAEIIAQAGYPGRVTIATNMAGRGTDIVLGGNVEVEIAALENPTEEKIQQLKSEWKARNKAVLEAGGLHILGTERHESRRIDNQLRGRAGRQGDPGLSQFYLSLEDSLMRIFITDRVRNMLQSLGSEGEPIESRLVSNNIEKAQKKVEGRNFDIRKQLLEYDDVANEQRKVIYEQRQTYLQQNDISPIIESIREDVTLGLVDSYIPKQSIEEQWDIEGLEKAFQSELGLTLPIRQWLDEDDKLYEETLRQRLVEEVASAYAKKSALIGDEMRVVEKQIMLQVLDNLWKEHLNVMDHLRQGVGLRGYGGKDPKREYKREAFEMFQELLESLKHDVVTFLMRLEIRLEDVAELEEQRRAEAEAEKKRMQYEHKESSALTSPEPAPADDTPMEPQAPFVREEAKVGRNDPCPCGSGKKYKQCHGQLS